MASAMALSAAAQTPAAEGAFAPISSLVPVGTPAVPMELVRKAAPYTEAREAQFEDWNPQTRAVLIRTRFGDVAQIHTVAEPLGARTQTTFEREPVMQARWQPRYGRYFVFLSDPGGEQYQLWRRDAKTGAVTRLTDGRSRNLYPAQSADGKWVAWASTARNGADLDLWAEDPEHPETAHMVAAWKGGGLQVQDWSPDSRRIAVVDYVSINQSTLLLVDAENGAVRNVTEALAAGEKVSWKEARFSADGKSLYVLSDWKSEFDRLWRVPVEGGAPVCLTPQVDHDVDDYALTADGRVAAYTLNDEGISRLHLMDAATLHALAAPKLPVGVVSHLAFQPQTGELGFGFSTPTEPYDVYTLKPGATEPTRWTRSETGGLDMSDEAPARLIHWQAKDGVRLSGFLFMPPAHFTGKRPVILDIHGGPEGQARPEYLDDYHQYHYFLREMGAALIYPNVRGSTGYGKSFTMLDNGVKREDSVTDIGALLDWIKTQPELDASRVLVAGMSYGGYMTLSVATQYNDRVAASIDTVGLSNIITFLERTAEYRRQLRRVEYGDERDAATRAALEKIAPANLAGNITKPIFILAGQLDPRVPYAESLQMADAVRKNDAPVWFLGMKDESHVFQKKPNIDYSFYLKILFVDRFLFSQR